MFDNPQIYRLHGTPTYNDIIEEAGKITRGHNFTLVKEHSRLDVRKFSFSQRTIVWNQLFADGVQASTVMFKNRIEKYLVRNSYTYSGMWTLDKPIALLSTAV